MNVLAAPRSSGYRLRKPIRYGPKQPSPKGPRALTEVERNEILKTLYSERFVNMAPRQVHATLLDEGRYLCSWRTMYRCLQSENASGERRRQRKHPIYKKPELIATGPNQVWTWDVTWLRGPRPYLYYPLYVVIDLFSHYCPAWMLAHHENAELAKRLIREACDKQNIEPHSLMVHADRGPVPKSKGLSQLYQELCIESSFSRPHVSNDNPFSEAQFKTVKYNLEFPERFDGYDHARDFCRYIFPWYNNEHRHSGIAHFTPADVHF